MSQPSPAPPIVAVEGILVETEAANSVGTPAHTHHLVLRTSIKASQRGYGIYSCQCGEKRELPLHFDGAVRRNAKTGYPELMPRVQQESGRTLLPHNWLTGA